MRGFGSVGEPVFFLFGEIGRGKAPIRQEKYRIVAETAGGLRRRFGDLPIPCLLHRRESSSSRNKHHAADEGRVSLFTPLHPGKQQIVLFRRRQQRTADGGPISGRVNTWRAIEGVDGKSGVIGYDRVSAHRGGELKEKRDSLTEGVFEVGRTGFLELEGNSQIFRHQNFEIRENPREFPPFVIVSRGQHKGAVH